MNLRERTNGSWRSGRAVVHAVLLLTFVVILLNSLPGLHNSSTRPSFVFGSILETSLQGGSKLRSFHLGQYLVDSPFELREDSPRKSFASKLLLLGKDDKHGEERPNIREQLGSREPLVVSHRNIQDGDKRKLLSSKNIGFIHLRVYSPKVNLTQPSDKLPTRKLQCLLGKRTRDSSQSVVARTDLNSWKLNSLGFSPFGVSHRSVRLLRRMKDALHGAKTLWSEIPSCKKVMERVISVEISRSLLKNVALQSGSRGLYILKYLGSAYKTYVVTCAKIIAVNTVISSIWRFWENFISSEKYEYISESKIGEKKAVEVGPHVKLTKDKLLVNAFGLWWFSITTLLLSQIVVPLLSLSLLSSLTGLRFDTLRAASGAIWAKCSFLTFCCKPKLVGIDHLPKEKTPLLFVANHTSFYDAYILMGFLPWDVRFISKIEIFSYPLLGMCMRIAGHIGINRGNLLSQLIVFREAFSLLKRGASLAAFPEETRSPDGHMRRLKPGTLHLARKTGVQIVPVSLRNVYGSYPPHALLPLTYPRRVEVQLHKLVPTKGRRIEDIMRDVESSIISGLSADEAPLPKDDITLPARATKED